MHNLSMTQALGIWEELVSAYHGKNGFGADTAEIYIYRLMPHVPVLPGSELSKQSMLDAHRRANESLVALIRHFETEHDGTTIKIVLGRNAAGLDEELPAADWILGLLLRDPKACLDHRVHLRVRMRVR
jgi:hypothetical protein